MAKDIKYIEVKYIPTGIVFNLPETDVIDTIKSDRGNFEVLDKDFKMPTEKTEVVTSTFEQVVGDDNADDREAELKKMTNKDLLEYCKANNIECTKTKKDEIIAVIIEAENDGTQKEKTDE
jgi:hypothetical protein